LPSSFFSPYPRPPPAPGGRRPTARPRRPARLPPCFCLLARKKMKGGYFAKTPLFSPFSIKTELYSLSLYSFQLAPGLIPNHRLNTTTP
jgi:hypothetical protein